MDTRDVWGNIRHQINQIEDLLTKICDSLKDIDVEYKLSSALHEQLILIRENKTHLCHGTINRHYEAYHTVIIQSLECVEFLILHANIQKIKYYEAWVIEILDDVILFWNHWENRES